MANIPGVQGKVDDLCGLGREVDIYRGDRRLIGEKSCALLIMRSMLQALGR